MNGAIFDVDGTLLDSMGAWYTATEKYFARYNRPLDTQTGVSFQEMTLAESTAYMHNVLRFPNPPAQIEHELKHLVAVEYQEYIPLKPYVREYLEHLRANGIRMAVATSGYLELCRAAFIRLGIWDFFEAYALSSEVGVNKSNPDIYLLAAKRLQIPPGNCTVYEDIVSGICGAKKAGMRTVGVYDRSNTDTASLCEHADRYILHFGELL